MSLSAPCEMIREIILDEPLYCALVANKMDKAAYRAFRCSSGHCEISGE